MRIEVWKNFESHKIRDTSTSAMLLAISQEKNKYITLWSKKERSEGRKKRE